MIRPPPRSTLFPYPTLFRSLGRAVLRLPVAAEKVLQKRRPGRFGLADEQDVGVGPHDVWRQTGIRPTNGDEPTAASKLIGNLAHAAHLGQVAGHSDQIPVAIKRHWFDCLVDDGDLHLSW